MSMSFFRFGGGGVSIGFDKVGVFFLGYPYFKTHLSASIGRLSGQRRVQEREVRHLQLGRSPQGVGQVLKGSKVQPNNSLLTWLFLFFVACSFCVFYCFCCYYLYFIII